MYRPIALTTIIPRPLAARVETDSVFPLKTLRTFQTEPGLEALACELQTMCRKVGIHLEPRPENDAQLRLRLDSTLPAEGWRLVVHPDRIELSGGDEAGVFYGLQAWRQILSVACMAVPAQASVECGELSDAPRYGWRGLMLDSARHVQSVETIKGVIDLMGALRLNVLHWHLTDNQGWRLPLTSVPPAASLDLLSSGFYTREEIREVVDYAKRHFIQLVPEIDVPGHSGSLLNHIPELACDPAHPGQELCLGNPRTMPFVKAIFDELMELFPHSRYIHIGGDEAQPDAWESCPACRKAMAERGASDLRVLENLFIRELSDYLQSKGRTPIVWGSGLLPVPGAVIQNWQIVQDLPKHAANGNKIINSVHSYYYLDYPNHLCEPHKNWMFTLSEENIYLSEPTVAWPQELESCLLGPEACLWTEQVPEWRLMQKLMHRLAAFAEVAWAQEQAKSWPDFRTRRETLETAAWRNFL